MQPQRAAVPLPRRPRLGDLVLARLEELDLLRHQLGVAAALVVEPAPHDHDGVRGEELV